MLIGAAVAVSAAAAYQFFNDRGVKHQPLAATPAPAPAPAHVPSPLPSSTPTPTPTPEPTPASTSTTALASNVTTSPPTTTTPENAPLNTAPAIPVDVSPMHVPYVIVGAGTTAYFAAVGIKRRDKDAQVLIIGNENEAPYGRPPLSKELWFRDISDNAGSLAYVDWSGKPRSIYFQEREFYCTTDDLRKGDNCVALLANTTVIDIDVQKKTIKTSDGREITYSKCLLATGGSPKSLPIFDTLPDDAKSKVTLFRSTADFRALEKSCQENATVAIIGGGFLGSELAAALSMREKKGAYKDNVIYQIYPEKGNMAKVLPEYLSNWSTQKIKDLGVHVFANESIASARSADGKIVLGLGSGKEVAVDRVIVAVGLQPNTALAEKAQLEIDPIRGGILVNAELEARSDLYAAGDVASFYDITLGRRREEHHDNAVVSGRLAGENMAGAKKHYQHQSFFWSDLGPDIGYEAIGIIDSSLETVGVWAKGSKIDSAKQEADPTTAPSIDPSTAAPVNQLQTSDAVAEATTPAPAPTREYSSDFGKGVVFYLRDKRVVGVVAWNLPEKIPIARKIIREAKQHDNFAKLAALFKINSTK